MFQGATVNRQQQRSDETRAALLSAGEACFARSGYDLASVDDICRAAGVSKGAFYHHFASKQQLFLELLNRWLEGTDRQLAALRDEATSVPEALTTMIAVLRGVFAEAGDRLPIYLEFWTRAARDKEVWQGTIEPYRRYRDFFAAMVAAGVEQGSLQPVDPQNAARVIVAMGVGLLVQSLLSPDETDWEKVSQEAIRLLLEGLQQR